MNLLQQTKKNQMKPFDLEEAKLGKPVITRDWRKVKILATDVNNEDAPIVAVITNYNGDELVRQFRKNGYYTESNADCLHLCMKTEKKVGFIGLYKMPTVANVFCSIVCGTAEEVKQNVLSLSKNAKLIDVIEIEYDSYADE